MLDLLGVKLELSKHDVLLVSLLICGIVEEVDFVVHSFVDNQLLIIRVNPLLQINSFVEDEGAIAGVKAASTLSFEPPESKNDLAFFIGFFRVHLVKVLLGLLVRLESGKGCLTC